MSVIDTHIETLNELFQKIEDNHLQSDLEEAEQTLKEMKIEIITIVNKAKRDDYLEKINNYQKLISKYRKQSLIGNKTTSRQSSGQESFEILKKSNAQLAETEAVGIDILVNLNGQKEKIAKIKKNTVEISQELSYSNKLMNRMLKWWRG